MTPKTAATFEYLANADWFSTLGERRDGPFVVLSSWDEAIEQCGSADWEDLTLEAANRYTEAVAARNGERFRAWNESAVEIRAAVLPLIAQKVHPVATAYNLPPIFETAVRWDMIHFCLECEFADVFPPGFFASQAYWYMQGRFPCGWQGNFPEGKLVLY